MRLTAHAGGGLARVRLEQTFTNDSSDPLAVTYQLPLPADGAVSAFAFRIGDRRIAGEVDRRERARERFEEALAGGRSAALLEQDRQSLFTQEIGNIPPGAEVVAEIGVDQPLAWIDGGLWEWRFPTTVAPRYLGTEGRVEDAKRITVDVTEDAMPPRLHLALSIHDEPAAAEAPNSPSHDLTAVRGGQATELRLKDESGTRLDRDLVVRWKGGAPEVGTTVETARPAKDRAHARTAYGLLSIVPPEVVESSEALARDVILLIDASGSMWGSPLQQAKRVLSAIVRTLTQHDRLEMIAFAGRPRRWSKRLVHMTERGRAAALQWIDALQAGGGTEMCEAVIQALRPLSSRAQRQVVLVTDGLIGFEDEIVREVHGGLPSGSRLHTVAVGSAPNRSLTRAAARAGRGVEVVVGLDEDPEPAARRIAERTSLPVLVDLHISGNAVLEHAPERIGDLFGRAPALVALKLRSEGGELLVRGRTAAGEWERTIPVPSTPPGCGRGEIVSLFGREHIEDLEMQVAAGADTEEIDPRIEHTGMVFQIASRLTSWIAVCSEPGVDPQQPTRHERIPHELPWGTSVEGLGLRSAGVSFMQSAPEGSDLKFGVRADGHGLMDFLEGEAELGASGHSFLRDAAEEEEMDVREGMERHCDQLQGRIRIHRDGRLVLQIEGHDADWHLPDRVVLVSADGRTFEAEVDPDRTTRPGSVEPGRWIRLSLRLPDGAGTEPPVEAQLEWATWSIVVELD